MGGTGLEPVTPSLSSKSEPSPSDAGGCRSGRICEFQPDDDVGTSPVFAVAAFQTLSIALIRRREAGDARRGIVPASKRRELPLDPLRSSKFCLNDGKLVFPLSPKDLVPLPSPWPRARFSSPAS
jgi:hypothetical protein